jgi:hypothetical protein
MACHGTPLLRKICKKLAVK